MSIYLTNSGLQSFLAYQLNQTNKKISTSLERLATGMRINSAADDPGGLSSANRLAALINGYGTTAINITSAISAMQTADGAVAQSSSILMQMRDLAVQASNDTLSLSERSSLQVQMNELNNEFDRIGRQTQYGRLSLLDGTYTNKTLQLGPNAGDTLSVSLSSIVANQVGDNTLSSSTSAGSLGAVNGGSTNNNFAAQSITVRGQAVSSAMSFANNTTAQSIASAVNAVSGTTNVTARASNTATLTLTGGTGTLQFSLRGDSASGYVTVSANVASSTDASSVANAINSYSATTGITASSSGAAITLKNSTGADITLQGFDGTNSGVTATFGTAAGTSSLSNGGTTSAVVGGKVEFHSSGSFSVTTSTGTTFQASASVSSSFKSVSGVDLTSQSSAQQAISTIDSALSQLDTQAAQIGAYENRLANTRYVNDNTALNLASAYSAITSSDYAIEMTNLVKSQILRQSATALIAQANNSAKIDLFNLMGIAKTY